MPPQSAARYNTVTVKPPTVHAYHKLAREGNWTAINPHKRKPPQWLLDKLAEEQLTGKFNTAKANKCPVCNTYRSAQGGCWC